MRSLKSVAAASRHGLGTDLAYRSSSRPLSHGCRERHPLNSEHRLVNTW